MGFVKMTADMLSAELCHLVCFSNKCKLPLLLNLRSTSPNKKPVSNPPVQSPVSPKTQTRAPFEVLHPTAPWSRPQCVN